ncbi:hypothetical protein FRC01_002859 [Tulasnella sp. 417]|nr:hypothetical protein FRC01_002859 [Tulasnella sp. 417]
METVPRVSFARPPPSEPPGFESSPVHSVEDLDESGHSLTAAWAILESLAHLVISPERLTFVDYPVSHGGLCNVYFAKLDETSQTPKDVAVERLLITDEKHRLSVATMRLARQLKAWNGLKHPNVLELLGYYLSPNCDTAQIISPYKINGGLREYCERNNVGIAQRLGFGPFGQRGGLTAMLLRSMINRDPPGPPETLLDLVPGAPKPEYASTLRLLHSFIPLCWDYEPRKRPQISLVRRQAFMFSFESDAGDSVVATLEELAHLLIPPERLRLVERSELGSGNYGEVVLGTLDESTNTPRDVAVKKLKAVGTRGERVRLAKRLARELNIWAKVKHPNVVELIGYYLDEKYESPMLISALMHNGDVLKYIENYKPDIQQRIAFMKGITAGLACLHGFDPAICHADLKPANVLLDLHMNAVLCDFGLASFVGGSPSAPGLVTTATLKGTPRYMSPELHLDDDCTHNLESDVWAWACTVFHVLTGNIPYVKAVGERQLCMAIAQEQPPGDIELLLPSHFVDANSESALALRFLRAVIPRCWDFEPQRRPSMSTLLSQMSNLTSEIVDALSRMEDGGLDGLDTGATPVEASEISAGGRTDQDEVAQEGNQGLLESDHLRGEEPTDENVMVDHEETEAKGATNDDEPSTNVDAQEDILINAGSQNERVVEENVGVNRDEAAMKDGGDNEEQQHQDHGVTGDQVTNIAPNRLPFNISTPPLSKVTLGAACMIALLSTIAYQSLRTSDSLPPPDSAAAIRPDHSPDNISTQPFSTFIWPAAFILSVCANIYFVYFAPRKAGSSTPLSS